MEDKEDREVKGYRQQLEDRRERLYESKMLEGDGVLNQWTRGKW